MRGRERRREGKGQREGKGTGKEGERRVKERGGNECPSS